MRNAALLTMLVLTLAVGCRKPKPSPEYADAKLAYGLVIDRMGDDAFSDPEMTRIEGLLKSVPAESLDAPAAQAMLSQIVADRARVIAEEEARRKALENALVPPPMPESASAPAAAPTPSAPEAKPTDGLTIGITVAEIVNKTGGCFVAGQQIIVRGADGESRAQLYELQPLGDCISRFGDLKGKSLVVQEGKLLRFVERSELKLEQRPADAGAPAP